MSYLYFSRSHHSVAPVSGTRISLRLAAKSLPAEEADQEVVVDEEAGNEQVEEGEEEEEEEEEEAEAEEDEEDEEENRKGKGKTIQYVICFNFLSEKIESILRQSKSKKQIKKTEAARIAT